MAKSVKYFKNQPAPVDFNPADKWLTIEEIKDLPETAQNKEYRKWSPERTNLVYLENTEYAKEHHIKEYMYLSDEELLDYLRPIEAEEKEKQREKFCMVSAERGGLKQCDGHYEGHTCATCPYFRSDKNQSRKAPESALYRKSDEGEDVMEFNYPDESTLNPLEAVLNKELEEFGKRFQDELSDADKELLRMTRLKIKDDDIAQALGITRRTIINRRNKIRADLLEKLKKYL